MFDEQRVACGMNLPLISMYESNSSLGSFLVIASHEYLGFYLGLILGLYIYTDI